MMIERGVVYCGFALFLAAAPGFTKPLLPSSQHSYASACLDQDASGERLIKLCTIGLEQSGSSIHQRMEMLNILAWQYYQADETQQAQALFEEILSHDSSSDDALLGLAWIAYDADDYARSSRLFSEVLQVTPSAQAIAGLASCLWRSDKVGFEEARERFQAAQAIDPVYRWAMREEAWLNIEHGGTFERAEALFQAVLDIEPEDQNALYGLTYIYTEQDRWEEGLEVANKALEIDPSYTAALSRRSLAYLYLDRPKLSLKDGQALVQATPDAAGGYVRVARAMDALGRREEAIGVLANANAQIGFDDYLIYWLARFLFFEKSYAKAEAQIKRILAEQEGDYYDYKLLGRIYMAQNDYALARSAFDQGMPLTEDTSWLRYYRSRILVAEGHYQKAEAEFDAAVAEGLPLSKLDRFIAYLVGQHQYLQAIKMRVRYKNAAD